MGSTHRVVIVGGGFGGLRAARALKDAPVDVTLVDRRNFHLFQPLLYQVATGSLSPGEIAAPLRGVLGRQDNTRVLLGEVVDVDPDAKRVRLADGAELEYDSLIVAAGSPDLVLRPRPLARVGAQPEEHRGGHGASATRSSMRSRSRSGFPTRRSGAPGSRSSSWAAGATGVELAGAIAEIARQTLRHDFRSIHPEEAQIILMDGAPRVLAARSPKSCREKASVTLARLGVQVRTGVMVKGIDKEGVTVQGPNGVARLDARTVIWAGGVAVTALGRTLAQRTQAETDKGGRIKVGPDLTIAATRTSTWSATSPLHRRQSGKPLAGVAQVAMQQGTYAGEGHRAQGAGEAAAPAVPVLRQGNRWPSSAGGRRWRTCSASTCGACRPGSCGPSSTSCTSSSSRAASSSSSSGRSRT